MPGTDRKNLLVAFLILFLAAAMQPQSSTSGGAGEAKPAATQAPSNSQAPNSQSSNSQSSNPQSSNPQSKEQKPAPVYESATVLKTITRLVVVDVVAADKNGPVTNLERNDFTILEDGKEQQIRVFNF